MRRKTSTLSVERPARSGLGPEYRELPLAFGAGGYLVFYHERGPNVHILAVRHMREAGY